jgi:hypothetical protein
MFSTTVVLNPCQARNDSGSLTPSLTGLVTASLPQPQRGIAESVDALAARTLPGLQRSVKWGMSYYGVGDGWCFCCGGFAGHVKLMFVNGAALNPVPPVTPVGMGKSTRGVEFESVDDIDERQIAAWMKLVAAVPGVGGKKR